MSQSSTNSSPPRGRDGDAPKSKKSRRSAPKSRKGCRTCKIRHVKCDEIRPACTRCTETGRNCDFLRVSPLQKSATYNKPMNLQPKYALNSSPDVSVNGRELDYFLKVCCVGFSGFFGDELFDRIIPQQCVAEPSIRYAAVALGIMHRSLAFERGVTPEARRILAATNYVKAISSLNSTLHRNVDNPELACMASLLFTMFEVSRGYDRVSMVHFNAGLEIVNNTSKTASRSSSYDIMDGLRCAFSRLELQATPFAVCQYSMAKIPRVPTIPSEFFGLVECRNVLDSIIALLHSFLTPYDQAYKCRPCNPLPGRVIRQNEEIKSLLKTWHDKYERYVKYSCLKYSQRDHTAAKVLKISYLSTSIFLDTYFNRYQTSFDAYYPLFRTMVDLTASVITFAAKTQSHSGRRVGFDRETVQPLQFVARRCRDRTLRRRAIELSDKAGREGAWDGKIMAAVLRWIVAKEEENLQPTQKDVALGLANFGDEVPQEKDRVHEVRVDYDRLRRKCLIHAMRRPDDKDVDGSLEDVELEGSIPWGAQQIEKGEPVGLVSVFLK